MRNTDSFYLKPMRCAHIGKVKRYMNCALCCAHEKMCVYARASRCGVYTFTSHSRLLQLTECETQIQILWKTKKKDFSGWWWQRWACRFESACTSFLNARATSLKTRVRGCFTHHCSDHLSSCPLCWCHLCQLEVHEDELHHVELGDELDEEDGWWCSSATCSAQFVLQSCYVNVSFHLSG